MNHAAPPQYRSRVSRHFGFTLIELLVVIAIIAILPAILHAEQNEERRAFYALAWHLGAAQLDLAALTADNIDWEQRAIRFFRKKTRSVALLRSGEEVAALLGLLPTAGLLLNRGCVMPGEQRVPVNPLDLGLAQQAQAERRPHSPARRGTESWPSP